MHPNTCSGSGGNEKQSSRSRCPESDWACVFQSYVCLGSEATEALNRIPPSLCLFCIKKNQRSSLQHRLSKSRWTWTSRIVALTWCLCVRAAKMYVSGRSIFTFHQIITMFVFAKRKRPFFLPCIVSSKSKVGLSVCVSSVILWEFFFFNLCFHTKGFMRRWHCLQFCMLNRSKC